MVIDSDAHINESLDALTEWLDAPYRSRAPKLVEDTLGLTRILMEGRLYPDPRLRQRHSRKVQGKDLGGTHRGAADPRARLDDLDIDGIDVQVVYGSLGLALTTIRDADFAVAMARALNDYYAAVLRHRAEQARADGGAAGAGSVGGGGGVAPCGRRARPSRRHGAAERRREGARRPGPRPAVRRSRPPRRADLGALGQWLASAGSGNRALRQPLHGARHRPSLRADDRDGGDPVRWRARRSSRASRVGFLEAGCGWVPYWVERLEEHYERRSAEMPRMSRSPVEYLSQGRCFVTAEPDERLVPEALDAIGETSVMYASDYPHSDSKFPYSVKAVRERDDLSDETKERVLGANALRYYGPRLQKRIS